MNWDTFFVLTGILKDAGLHWLYSSILGFLMFWWIVTISYFVYRNWSGNVWPNIRIRSFILGLGLCCALLSAFTAHCYIDGAANWWTKPIDAPLTINTDPNRYVTP